MDEKNDTNDRNDLDDTNDAKGNVSPVIKKRRSNMNALKIKQTCDFQPRPKIRLSEIERLIKKHRIIVPPPSRQTLIKLCEDGTFETAGTKPSVIGWLVFEDSFFRWANSLDEKQDADGGTIVEK